MVHTANDPASLIPVTRKRLRALDPSLPPPETKTIAKLVSDSLSGRYFQVRLSGGFAAAALALALIGIYGVVAYSVAQRRTGVAVRLALGASRADVFRLLLRGGFRPVLFGLVFGLLALGSAQLLRSVLFGVKLTDPLTMCFVLALLAAAVFCACLLRARRRFASIPPLLCVGSEMLQISLARERNFKRVSRVQSKAP